MLFEKQGMKISAPPQRMVYNLAAAVFLSTLGIGVFAFAIPLLVFHEKGSGLWLGAAFSGYFLAKLAISPVAGRLSDKTGPKPLLFAAAIIGLLAPLAAFFSLHHKTLYTIQICLGLSAGVMKPVATAAIAAVVPQKRRGRIFGLCNALYNAAFFLGPVLGGLLYYHRNLTPVLGFLAACMAVSLAVILVSLPAGLSTAPDDPVQKRRVPEDRRLRAGLLLTAICGRTAGTAALIAFYPALLSENLPGPTWLIGLLFATPSLTACLSLPLGGWLADRLDREILAAAGMAVSAVCLGLTGRMETVAGFLLTGIFLGFGSGISFPAALARASSMGRRQGNIMGWFHMAANGGFVIGPVLCGLLVKHFGQMPLPMAGMGLLGLAAAFPLAAFRLIRPGTLQWRPAALSMLAVGFLVLTFFGIRNESLQPAGQAATRPETSSNFAGVAMGNVVRLTLSGVDPNKSAEDSEAAFETIDRLEAEFDHRNGSGSVGRVNLAAGTAPVQVEKAAFDLIRRALEIGNASNGVFDITIGAVTVLPYYYQEKAQKEKAGLVDYRKVILDAQKQTVFLPEAGMALDLGGLAKGTVLDAAAETLRKRGVPAALVEAGGDLYCYGDRKWSVGIQDPRAEGMLGVIRVSNAGVCGSGDYYLYAMTEENGAAKRKHHILDPELLDSADKSIAVTVVAPSAELADALATALFILGPKEGQRLLDKYRGCSALWILPDKSLVAGKGFPPFSQL
jgi:thiamine biosynthesis lipoprotein